MFYQDPVHQPFFFDRGHAVGALLIHGFPGSPAETRLVGETLAEGGVTARGILLPGFGPEIENLPDQSRKNWVDAAASAWQEMQGQFDRTLLVGYSMGGAVATLLAAEEPPDQLVLLAPFWRFPSWVPHYLMPIIRLFKKEVTPLDLGGDIDDPDFQAELKRFIPDIEFDDKEDVLALMNDLALPTYILEEVWRLGREAYEVAQDVRANGLIIQGTDDKIVLPDHTRQLVKRIRTKGAVDYQTISNDHHFVKSKGPFLDLVNQFVSGSTT